MNSVAVLVEASRGARPSETTPVVLADAGVENVNAQADEHHWSAAPRLGLHGAEVLELHDRSVVALPEDRMKRLASFVAW